LPIVRDGAAATVRASRDEREPLGPAAVSTRRREREAGREDRVEVVQPVTGGCLPRQREHRALVMRDILSLAVTAAFFVLCVAYVRWCDHIIGPDPELTDDEADTFATLVSPGAEDRDATVGAADKQVVRS
jgi:hypothetical protein